MTEVVFDNLNAEEETQPSIYEAVFTEPNVAPANAEQQAAQVAFVESENTGEDFESALERNKFEFNTSDSALIRERNAIQTEDITAPADDELAIDKALAGDVEGAVATVRSANTAVTHEDTVVATMAPATTPGEKLLQYSQRMQTANIIGEMQAKAERDKIPYLDALSNIVSSIFLPGHNARTDHAIIENAINLEKGNFLSNSVAKTDPFVAIKDYMSYLAPEEQATFLQGLYEVAQEHSGVLFDNPYEVERFFQKLQEYTTTDAEFENVFSVIDAATYPVALVGMLTKTIVKGGNAVVAKAVGNADLASKTVARDILNNTAVSGVPESELISVALKAGKNPFEHTAGVLDGIDEQVKQQLSEFAASRDLQELLEMAGPTGIDHIEYTELARKYGDFYKANSSPNWKIFKTLDVDDQGVTMEAIMKPSTKDGFASEQSAKAWASKNKVDYDAVFEEDGLFYLRKQFTHEFIEDDVSPYNLVDQKTNLVQYLPAPVQFPLHGAAKESVTTRILGVHQEDAARLKWEKLHKKAVKGLNKTSEDKVYAALIKGNDDGSGHGRVFTSGELDLLGLTNKEKRAYYELRMLRDSMHVVHDKALTSRMRFLNFKEVNYTGQADEAFRTAGKTVEREQAHAMAQNGEVTVLDLTGNTPSRRTIPASNIDKMYDDEYKLMNIADPRMLDGQQFDTILIRAKDVEVKPLTSVLPYRPGEYSRIYTDPYFVTVESVGFKNGVKGIINRTVRTAATKSDADAYIKGMNEAMRILRYASSPAGAGFTGTDVVKAMGKYVDNPRELMQLVRSGELDINAQFAVKFDREAMVGSLEHTDSVLESLFSTGRLFTSKRGERLRNVFGEEAPVKSPKEAMAQEMSYLSRFTNIAVWRETEIAKLLKTYPLGEKLRPIQGGTKYEQAFHAEPINMTRVEEKTLNVLRNHLRTQFGIPSEEALKARQRMVEWAEAISGVPFIGKKGERELLSWRAKSPTQFLRTMVFHGFLGMFNLAQFMVQANGAIVAAAVHPLYGLKAATAFGPLRGGLIFRSVGNDAAVKELAKKAAPLMGMKPQEFIDTVELIHKSGILNSIKSSALHYVKEGAVDLDTHLVAFTSSPTRAAKKVGSDMLKVGMAPFNRGEEFTRIVAFDIARREWMKANPGAALTSRKALDEILERQEVLTIGMSRANIGRVQQGWASVPFQFVQYNWKLAQSLLGHTFTSAEKVRILGAASLMYGANGMGVDWLLDEVLGDAAKDMDKGTKLAYTEGLLSYAIYEATGAETAVGSRIGPLKYWSDMVKNITSGELSVMAMFAGPSGSFLEREAEMVNEVIRIFNVEGVDLGDKTQETLFEVMRANSAGWRNVSKYLIQASGDGYLRSRRGNAIARITPAEAWFAVLGFGSSKEYEAWDTSQILREASQAEDDYASTMSKLYMRYYQAETRLDADKYYNQIVSFTNALPEGMKMRVAEKALKSIQRDPMLERNIMNIEKRIAEGTVEPIVSPSVTTGVNE